MDQPILELKNVTKAFGHIVANNNISLQVYPGRVHAIVGENGAGKTTLMTMVAGTAQPDSGTISVAGQQVTIDSPKRADELGIGMVHQHFKLVPSLSVAANVFLGREIRTSFGSLDVKAMVDKVRELSSRFGLEIDPDETVRTLSVGERQRVEVIKALSHDTRVLILDEPTAVLTPSETDDLFIVIRQLAAQGCAVLFISHKLGEVLSIADEVTVIRDGAVVGTRPAAGLTETSIASMMVGREVLLRIVHTPSQPTTEVLTVEGLCAVDERGALAVNDVSLSVRRGEIVGIAGVEGNGQSELAAAIAGMTPIGRGTVTIAGRDVTDADVATRREAGMAYIPEDRHDEGAAPALTVAENVVATHLNPPRTSRGMLRTKAIDEYGQKLIDEFDVRGAQPRTLIGALSGGNMQKVIIAREFSAEPEFLMVSQPTRGVDVGAMEFVHNSIVEARDKGAGVLLFSADLNEVMSLSDRLIVLYRGKIIAEFEHDDVNEIAVGLAMAGSPPTPEKLAEAEREHAKAAELLAEQVGHAAESSTATEAVDAESVDTESVDTESVGSESTSTDSTTDATRPAARAAATPVSTKSRFAMALEGAAGPLIAVGLALLVGALIILAIGHNPLMAYKELFTSPWTSTFGFASLLASVVPLLVLSSAVIISFRAGFFNIGGEGQMYLGAFVGAWAGYTFTSLPTWLLAVVVLLLGALVGALWGAIPGALFGYWKVDIVVTTLLMSTVAIRITEYFVTGPARDPEAGIAGTVPIKQGLKFPYFVTKLSLGPDLVISIIIAIVMGLVLTRSVWGLWARELGQMNRFAEYTGISPQKMSVQVMAVAGGLSGFAGALWVLGPSGGRFLQNFSPGYGFLGITVALLGRLNPWATMLAAVFYANLMAGSTGLQSTGVPYPLVNVIQGLIVVFITAQFAWSRWRKRSVDIESSPRESGRDGFENVSLGGAPEPVPGVLTQGGAA